MSLDTNINDTNKNEEKTNILGFFKRHYILTGFLIVIIAITGWWKYQFPSATWNYKLTVTVETPEGIKTGSAVREVYASAHPGFMGVEAKVHHYVQGEAVVIDMGQGKYLFAIMDVDGSYRIVRDAFPYYEKSDSDYIRHYKSLKESKKSLLPNQYPTFVTFTDIKDPKTVTLVYGTEFDPATQQSIKVNRLEELFGAGVKLRDITIEMTDEDVTHKIDFIITKDFWNNFDKWWNTLNIQEKSIKANLFNFKVGE